ncbi:cAMP-binding domain of CRP or a regulatory subunit of cAMP-dependent protein kinases [Anaerovirgula multivorans]|uniref:cAMP-binding domain of CRP or a regulatory subunit of cAMP-dependent protein kinases n=1 Tax=Anaerovirgula multivorans TaxID=312168 RepID=A0A239CAQ0_9FIRM|nr:Crp/Fnr family transcriptional regulator [Anaerovirgula multivorans]SNS16982.1 cAMP-binding domain of CRP or a regulatory subunit of cAMP-dependent protein kinases [Anaerovirgula multivorans]
MSSSIRFLNHCVLFKHLSKDEIEELLSDITYTIRLYKKNEVVFSPHDFTDTLGIILDGCIEVQKIFASGKVLTVNRRFPYDLIADASLFADINHYPSTISACENSQIFLINKSNLLQLFSKDQSIMANFLKAVSNRVLALNKTIDILSLNSVPAKIAYFLIMEQRKQKSLTIKLEFTKKSLAEHLNVSRPTLSRELKNLQTKGIISFVKRKIEIHSLEKLEQICSH